MSYSSQDSPQQQKVAWSQMPIELRLRHCFTQIIHLLLALEMGALGLARCFALESVKTESPVMMLTKAGSGPVSGVL